MDPRNPGVQRVLARYKLGSMFFAAQGFPAMMASYERYKAEQAEKDRQRYPALSVVHPILQEQMAGGKLAEGGLALLDMLSGDPVKERATDPKMEERRIKSDVNQAFTTNAQDDRTVPSLMPEPGIYNSLQG